MIIVIDIGNTTVSVAGVEDEEVRFTGKTDTNRDWSAEEYRRRLSPILEGRSCRGAILSSVVPQLTEAVRAAAASILRKRVMVVTPATKTGLTVALPEPDRVGRDRLVDAAWAAAHYPLPAVTADLGTATTLNVILPGGIFAGGVICAGIQTGLRALAQCTAQLPRLELAIPDRVVGRSTEECMRSGAVAGTAAMIDGLVARIEEEIGAAVTLLVTGGGGEYVTSLLRHRHVFDPHITRKGLALLFELNQDEEESPQ